MSWRVLAVGWLRGWARREDVSGFADRQLEADGSADSHIALLALPQTCSDTDVRETLLSLANATGEPLADAELRDLEERLPLEDVPLTLRRDLDTWRLARLLALQAADLDDDAVLEALDVLWADFGYPRDMESVSEFYFTPQERASGCQATPKTGNRPFRTMEETIARLRRELLS